jgi:hypothetical protein
MFLRAFSSLTHKEVPGDGLIHSAWMEGEPTRRDPTDFQGPATKSVRPGAQRAAKLTIAG